MKLKNYHYYHQQEVNRLRAASAAAHAGTLQRLTRLRRQIDNLVDAVAQGRASLTLLERLETLEAEKDRLQHELDNPAPEPVRFHPNVAKLYAAKVADLRTALMTTEPATKPLQSCVR